MIIAGVDIVFILVCIKRKRKEYLTSRASLESRWIWCQSGSVQLPEFFPPPIQDAVHSQPHRDISILCKEPILTLVPTNGLVVSCSWRKPPTAFPQACLPVGGIHYWNPEEHLGAPNKRKSRNVHCTVLKIKTVLVVWVSFWDECLHKTNTVVLKHTQIILRANSPKLQ